MDRDLGRLYSNKEDAVVCNEWKMLINNKQTANGE